MAGYREITVAGGEGRSRAPAAKVRRASAGARNGWRPVLTQALTRGAALCREKPGSVFGAVAAMGAAMFICVNALGHQTGRHPAPILPKLEPKMAVKAPAEPPPAPREVAATPAPKPVAQDAIGDLIRAEDTTASVTPKTKPIPPAKPATPAADQAVLRAQRALAKLGYGPMKADGAMGPATRAAIEKFERDRKLPVTGEAAGRTLRALESGSAKG